MRLLDWVSSEASILDRGVQDSRRAAAFVRHTLRGNRVRAADPGRPVAGRRPVLLIHGYLATRGSLHLLDRHLTRLGHVVVSHPLGLVHNADIRESAARIAAKVEALAAQTDLHQLDIVGHSMGGLVALYYLKRLGGRRRIRRLVMLGTPIAGTWSALAGMVLAPLSPAALQLLPDSAFLQDLEQGPLPQGVEVYSLSGRNDWLAPPKRTRLVGVHHMSLPTNHAGLLVDADVAQVVSDLLDGQLPSETASSGALGR
jgi:triacylglycerol lipase